MAIVSVLQEHSPFVFKSYPKQVDLQQKRFIIRKWGFLVVFVHRLFAAIVVLLAFYVAFASRFYSIKVFHRFNNIERDMKFYLISEN